LSVPTKAENINRRLNMTSANLTLREEADRLARQLFGSEEAGTDFANHVLDICARARGKDFLIVHNPGGWGHARLDQCLEWERSIVEGIRGVIEEMGYSLLLTQYFRSGTGWREQMRDLREQFRFFAPKAGVMASWLRFILTHLDDIKVILVGISQGAAFSSAVLRQLGGRYPVYSIELGFPFQYKSWRIITPRTLVMDSNGVRPDILAQGNLRVGARILMAAPFKWMWYRLRRKRVAFAHCVNAPGHEYDWSNPEIQKPIRDFLKTCFGAKK
jgi:pimeloyl-ACP methyl ester carboxylesterase